MKKILTILFVLIIISTSIIPAFAITTVPVGDYTLVMTNSGSEWGIYKYEGNEPSITIPNKYNNRFITSVSTFAFSNTISTNLTNLVMGDNINTINSYAFYALPSLKVVEMKSTLKTIEESAFADCVNLEKVYLNDEIESIDKTAFLNCSKLTIYCNSGTYVETFAKSNGISYVLLDVPQPTETTAPITETETVTQPVTEPVKDTYIVGDVNDDKSVTITDATMIQQVIAKLIPSDDRMEQRGDTSFEGSMSISDVTRIQQFLASIEVDVNHVGETREYK